MYVVIVNGKKVFYTPSLVLANNYNRNKHNSKGQVKNSH